MDLADRASAFTRAEQRVLTGGLRRPTETALALRVFVTHVSHRRRHLDKLFKIFLVCVSENGVRTVAFLLLRRLINLHLVSFTDFFDRELYPANFQDVLLLNFVILSQKLTKSV